MVTWALILIALGIGSIAGVSTGPIVLIGLGAGFLLSVILRRRTQGGDWFNPFACWSFVRWDMLIDRRDRESSSRSRDADSPYS